MERIKAKETKAKEDQSKTVFFNCGKWEVRKGHDVLVEAFNLAFSELDNVELWMMCENPFFDEKEQSDWIGLYKNSKLGKKLDFAQNWYIYAKFRKIVNFRIATFSNIG